MQQPLMFFFAFLAVLAMIGAAAWLVRRFAGNRLGTHTKSGRMPRLAVIDAAAVDGRRRLVLVRRDNVEHLLMIGGPSDIVIETSIVRANPAREAVRTGPSVEPRLGPADWETETAPEAPEPVMPELPPRPARPSFADEPRRPGPPPMPPRRTSEFPASDPFAGLAPEPMVRPELPPIGRPEPRPEPRAPEPRLEPAPRPRQDPVMPRPPRPELPKAPPPIRAERPVPPPPVAPPAPPAPAVAEPPSASALSAADQNLAEMANRLEAALRRPPDVKPDAPAAAETPARPAPRAPEPRAPEPRPEPPAAAPATKSGFESLEDEMASLLGRPKTPS
ncbi:flagellar biosynthetic protein FliO [Rhodopseudomonas telluris]|uniref:Flagellar biosynthetic protein FliO n=1 Tax=Rhodopseudomonas telluris TaxID=644215 RepID=A0ABV6ETL8_9BRAD